MASKVTKKLDKESKVIKCKNCRQDISKDKMFLHEGFCTRNNVFCEHCEKVFLKKDYEIHVKLIPKFLSCKEKNSSPNSQKSKETQPDTLKPSSFTEENDNKSVNMRPLIPQPSLKIVQMPITELYKINEPIFVSETGQIVSNKNNNDYILPFLGINFRSSKISEKIIDDIIDQGEIFKENNTISQNCYDVEGLNNLLNKNNYNLNTHSTMTINTDQRQRNRNISFGFSSLQGDNDINYLYKNSLMNRINSPLSKTIDIHTLDSIRQHNKENMPLNREPDQKTINTIYINKSIANHSQKILSTKYNFFSFNPTPKKSPINNTIVANSMKKSSKENIPLDKTCKNTPKRKEKNNLDDSYEYNNYPSNRKEPRDSNSKRNSNKLLFKFSRFSGAKNEDPLYKSERTRKFKGQYDTSTCEYCHKKYVSNKFEAHIQNCKSKKKRFSKIYDIPKPKKKQTIKNIEKYIFEDSDEDVIDEKKRETLTRQFNPSSLNVISLNSLKNSNVFIPNPERQIYSPKYLNDPQKISLKKNLFQGDIEKKNEKKNFPEDSNRKTVDKVKLRKLRKRLYKFSLETNTYDGKYNKSLLPEKSTGNLKSGEIDSLLYFNNNKIIYRFPKDKNFYKNTII